MEAFFWCFGAMWLLIAVLSLVYPVMGFSRKRTRVEMKTMWDESIKLKRYPTLAFIVFAYAGFLAPLLYPFWGATAAICFFVMYLIVLQPL